MDEHTIGQNIREIRLRAGLSLTTAAKRAELTKSTLSKIETGQISSPISTLSRIAKALNVTLAGFFVAKNEPPPYVLTRKGKGQAVTGAGSRFGYSYEGLAWGKLDKTAEPFLITIQPDDPPGEFHHIGQEFIFMLSGSMEFTIGSDTFKLHAGDSLYFDSSILHKTHILSKKPVQFLCLFIQDIPAKRS